MPDYISLPKLAPERVAQLKELYAELNPPIATAHRVRMGANIGSVVSHYKDSRWFRWTAAQRQIFKDAFDNRPHIQRALIGYFLEFPEKDGFLDLMTTWEGRGERCAVIIAHALNDGQHIWLNGKKVVLQAGDGIAFHVSVLHEVKKSKHQSLWANTMCLGLAADFA